MTEPEMRHGERETGERGGRGSRGEAGLGRHNHPCVYSTGKKGGTESLMEGRDGLVYSPSGQ